MPIFDKLGREIGEIAGASASKNAIKKLERQLIDQGHDPELVQAAAKQAQTPEQLADMVSAVRQGETGETAASPVASAIDSQREPVYHDLTSKEANLGSKIDAFVPEAPVPSSADLAPIGASSDIAPEASPGGMSMQKKLALGAGAGLGAAALAATAMRPSTSVAPLPPKEEPKQEAAPVTKPSPVTKSAIDNLDLLGDKVTLGKVKPTVVKDMVDHTLESWAKSEMDWAKENQPQEFNPAKYDKMRTEAQAWYDKEKGRLETKDLFMGLGRIVALLAAGGVFGKGTGAGMSAPLVEQATRYDIEPQYQRAAGEMKGRMGDIAGQQEMAQREAGAKRQTWADRLRSALGAQEAVGRQDVTGKQVQSDITSHEQIKNAELGERSEEFRQRELDRQAMLGKGREDKQRAVNMKLEQSTNKIDMEYDKVLGALEGMSTLKTSAEKKAAQAKVLGAISAIPGMEPEEASKIKDNIGSMFSKGAGIDAAREALIGAREAKKNSMRQAAGGDYAGQSPAALAGNTGAAPGSSRENPIDVASPEAYTAAPAAAWLRDPKGNVHRKGQR